MRRQALGLLAAAHLAGLCACGSGASIGKGNYGWVGVGNQGSVPEGKGALRVHWTRQLTQPARGAYRPVENAVAAIDNQHARIYVGAESGNLHAMGFDGRALYRFELHEPIECEPALDPVKQELYVGTERGEFYAIAAEKGGILWKKEGDAAIRQRPVLLPDAVIVITEEDAIEAYARADGKMLWRYAREPQEGFLVAGHSGMTLTEDNRLLAGFNDGLVVSLDALDGTVKWERNTSLEVPETEPGRPRYIDVDTTPAIIGEQVFVASFGGGLYALDLNNGSVLWREPDWTGITSLVATPDDALILVSADRGVVRFDVNQRAAVWQKSLERGSFGVPELFQGMVLIGDSRGSLVALDTLTGDELGRIDSGHGFVARANLQEDGRGFVVTNGGVLLGMRVVNPIGTPVPDPVASSVPD
ncbi:MAG: PQQ-binding-like beta-propeller repeat protein [Myxococcales bacterium]